MQTQPDVERESGYRRLAGYLAVALVLVLALSGVALWRAYFLPAAWAGGMPGPGYGYGWSDRDGYGWGRGMMGPGFGYGWEDRDGYGWGRGMMGGYGRAAEQKAIAGALGMSVEDLIKAHQAGKTVAALAGEKQVDLQKVTDAVMTPHRAAMAAMVSAGHMTQAQADGMLAAMETGLKAQFAAPWGVGPGAGMMGPDAGMGPWMMGGGYGMMGAGAGMMCAGCAQGCAHAQSGAQ